MKKIVVIGSVNIDTTLRVKHMPAIGETILSDDIKRSGGGKGGNQAMAMALLGGDVSLIARVGCDSNGDRIYESLKSSGLDMTGVSRDADTGTGEAYITVSDDGENHIVVYSGANAKLDQKQVADFNEIIKSADFCVLQMEIPIETIDYAVKECAKNGVSIILNPSPAQKLKKDTLARVDYLVPNETELELLAKGTGTIERAEQLLKEGVKNVLVTLGEKGCMLINHEAQQSFQAKKVVPKDTTAAGDSFLGGFVVGLAQALSLEDAIDLALSTAACTIMKPGAQDSLPTRLEVKEIMRLND